MTRHSSVLSGFYLGGLGEDRVSCHFWAHTKCKLKHSTKCLQPCRADQLPNKCKPVEFTKSVSKQMLERHTVAQNGVCTQTDWNIQES